MARHPLIVAYCAALIPGLVMAIAQPVWSRVDEAQHADFIVQLSHGVYPIADTTLIDSETLHLMQSTGTYRFGVPGTYPVPDLTDVGPPPAGMSLRANAAWMSRHLWQLSFESSQTPGYYLAMVPPWWVIDRLGGPLVAVYGIRIINALLIALLAPMAVVVAIRLSPGRAEIAVLAAAFAILLPGLALNGTRISNDGLAAVLGGLAIVIAVGSAGKSWTWRRAVLLGLALGAGLLVKLTLIGLAPALALAMLWPVRGTSWPRRFVQAAAAAALAAACLLPWVLINSHVYGAFLPYVHTDRLAGSLPMPFTPPFILVDVAVFFLSYWSGEPLGSVPLAGSFVVLCGLVLLIAGAGLISVLRLRPLAVPAGPLVVASFAVCGLVGITLLLPAGAGFEFTGPGRYAYPALPAIAALTGLGIHSALPNAVARRAFITIYAVAAVVVLAAVAVGFPGDKQPGPGTPPPDARIEPVSAANSLGGMVIRIDGVALDDAAKGTWIRVTVANSGSDEAEWTVAPVVSVGRVVAIGDYLRSTHLPGDVDAGQTVTGWLFVPLDPANLHGSRLLHVRFPDVAIDGYRIVDDVDLDFPLPALTG